MEGVKGYWRLPDKPDNQIAGVLYKSNEGSWLLDIFGNFEGSPFLTNNKSYPIINGISSKGVEYTLVDSFIKSQSASMPGFSEITIFVNIVCENLMISSKDGLKFSEMRASFLFLDDWIIINGFDYHNDCQNFSTKIEYQLPDPIKYNINDEFQLIINFLSNSSPSVICPKEISIRQSVEIRIVEADKTLDWYLEKFQIFQYLLMLLINNFTKKTYFRGNLSKQKNKLVEIYFHENMEKNVRKEILFTEFLCTFPDIQNKFQKILNTWFKNFQVLSSSYHLFFETAYQSGLNLENKFLNIVHAIESYHRNNKAYQSVYMDKDRYKEEIYSNIIKYIPKELEDDFKSSLKSRVKFGYEYSLRRRIKELFNSNEAFLKSFICCSDDLQKQIVDTRNYYTHYDEKSKFVMENLELYNLCEKLKVIFIALFLFDIGFDKMEVKNVIENQELANRLINVSGAKFEYCAEKDGI
jgi:hypothetical protein